MAVHFLGHFVLYAISIYYFLDKIREKLLDKIIEKLLDKIIEKLQEESRDDALQEINKYLDDRQLVCLLATAAGLHIAKKIAEYLVKISKNYVVVPLIEIQLNYLRIQLDYLLCYKSNIEGFRTQLNDLKNARANVRGLVNSAKNKDEVILPNVLKWQKNVDNIIRESKNILKDDLQLNLKLYCQRSKDAEEKTADVVELTRNANSFDRVSTNGLVYDSRKLVLENIMKALTDDRTSLIGIYGVRGVGKTTLAQEVQRQAEERNLFDVVVMSLVSKCPDVGSIRGEIADMLRPKLDANNQSRKPRKAQKLFERLKKIKKFLIILDGVRKGFKLADTGIPFGEKHRGCKILLTSRSKEVCNKCFVVNTTQKNSPIEVLTEEGGRKLFPKMAQLAGDRLLTLQIHMIRRSRFLKNVQVC